MLSHWKVAKRRGFDTVLIRDPPCSIGELLGVPQHGNTCHAAYINVPIGPGTIRTALGFAQ
jgi:hypothetical protein